MALLNYLIFVTVVISRVNSDMAVDPYEQEKQDLNEYVSEVSRLFQTIQDSNKTFVEKSREVEDWESVSNEMDTGRRGVPRLEKMMRPRMKLEEETLSVPQREVDQFEPLDSGLSNGMDEGQHSTTVMPGEGDLDGASLNGLVTTERTTDAERDGRAESFGTHASMEQVSLSETMHEIGDMSEWGNDEDSVIAKSDLETNDNPSHEWDLHQTAKRARIIYESVEKHGLSSENENPTDSGEGENEALAHLDVDEPERQRSSNENVEESKETYSVPFYFESKNRTRGEPRECLRDQNHITAIFQDCIYFQSDLANPEQQAEPTATDYDARFLKYCRKAPQLRNCIKTYILRKMEHCLDEGVRESIDNVEAVTTGVIKFICNKEADRLSMFIVDGGLECLYINTGKMLSCMVGNIGNYFVQSIFDLPSLNLRQSKCAGLKAAQVCVKEQLETCEDQTSANVVGLLFDIANEVAACGVLTGQQRTSEVSPVSDTPLSIDSQVLADGTHAGAGLVRIPYSLASNKDGRPSVASETGGASIGSPLQVEDPHSISSQTALSTPSVEENSNKFVLSNSSASKGAAFYSRVLCTLSISFLLRLRL